MKLAGLLGGAALMMAAAGPAGAQVQIDVNATQPLNPFFYKRPSSAGWYFTPTSTFFLNTIQTRFNPAAGTNVNRTVTVELWSNRPAVGGSLLRSGGFQSSTAMGVFGGGTFAPILLQAGIQYFIGFRNVQGLGVNYTTAPGSQSLGPLYFSLGPVFTDDLYERSSSSGDSGNPELRLIGTQSTTVPEPMTMTLLATGLAAMGGASYLRRRKQLKQ